MRVHTFIPTAENSTDQVRQLQIDDRTGKVEILVDETQLDQESVFYKIFIGREEVTYPWFSGSQRAFSIAKISTLRFEMDGELIKFTGNFERAFYIEEVGGEYWIYDYRPRAISQEEAKAKLTGLPAGFKAEHIGYNRYGVIAYGEGQFYWASSDQAQIQKVDEAKTRNLPKGFIVGTDFLQFRYSARNGEILINNKTAFGITL